MVASYVPGGPCTLVLGSLLVSTADLRADCVWTFLTTQNDWWPCIFWLFWLARMEGSLESIVIHLTARVFTLSMQVSLRSLLGVFRELQEVQGPHALSASVAVPSALRRLVGLAL